MASRVRRTGGVSRRASAMTSPLMGFSRTPDKAVSPMSPSQPARATLGRRAARETSTQASAEDTSTEPSVTCARRADMSCRRLGFGEHPFEQSTAVDVDAHRQKRSSRSSSRMVLSPSGSRSSSSLSVNLLRAAMTAPDARRAPSAVRGTGSDARPIPTVLSEARLGVRLKGWHFFQCWRAVLRGPPESWDS